MLTSIDIAVELLLPLAHERVEPHFHTYQATSHVVCEHLRNTSRKRNPTKRKSMNLVDRLDEVLPANFCARLSLLRLLKNTT